MRLPGLLIKQGRDGEAEQLRRFGLNPGRVNCLRVKERHALEPPPAGTARQPGRRNPPLRQPRMVARYA